MTAVPRTDRSRRGASARNPAARNRPAAIEALVRTRPGQRSRARSARSDGRSVRPWRSARDDEPTRRIDREHARELATAGPAPQQSRFAVTRQGDRQQLPDAVGDVERVSVRMQRHRQRSRPAGQLTDPLPVSGSSTTSIEFCSTRLATAIRMLFVTGDPSDGRRWLGNAFLDRGDQLAQRRRIASQCRGRRRARTPAA